MLGDRPSTQPTVLIDTLEELASARLSNDHEF